MKETPSNQGKRSGYRTYLLTCWQERDAFTGTVVWRFRLETPVSGQQRLFTLLRDVMVWIESELDFDHGNKEISE